MAFNLSNSNMATYESIVKIKGAVGDLVFYDLNGKNVVRKKSGFNKAAFKKAPSYEKVRQNSSEFGHCSKTGKIIRTNLNSYIKEAGDPLLYQKFAKLMTEIKDLDPVSGRGSRTVDKGLQTKEGKALLNRFQFGEKKKLPDGIQILDHILYVDEKVSADTITLVTICIDFENYKTECFEENISLSDNGKVNFKKQFSENDSLLYFVVLRKNKEITHMGFA